MRNLTSEPSTNPKSTIAVSRIYSREGHSLKFLLAEYRSRRAGLYHNPMNCYHTQGFTQIGRVEMNAVESP